MLRRLLRSAAWAFLLVGTGWALTVIAVLVFATRDDVVNVDTRVADAIVVLGAAQYAGRPSPVLKARLDHAVDLWERGLAPYLLLTGGRGTGDTQSEADVGRKYVVRRGVPDSMVLSEDEGRTTLVSMQNAADRLSGIQAQRVLLVSDPFHMLRLAMLARLHGVTPYISPTRTSPISSRPRIAFEYVLRESLAVPADLVQFTVVRFLRAPAGRSS